MCAHHEHLDIVPGCLERPRSSQNAAAFDHDVTEIRHIMNDGIRRSFQSLCRSIILRTIPDQTRLIRIEREARLQPEVDGEHRPHSAAVLKLAGPDVRYR